MEHKNSYKYYTNGNMVVAVTTYAGRIVRGVAKCSPDDAFDLEVGKKLAKLRCDLKVAQKREKRAAKEVKETGAQSSMAKMHYRKALTYLADAQTEAHTAFENLKSFERSL